MKRNQELAVLGLLLLLPVLITSCASKPEPKTVVKTSATGKKKWQTLFEGVGQPVTDRCQLEEWKTEWSDGSTDYKWKSLGCRPMTDFEKRRQDSLVQKATPSQGPISSSSVAPSNKPNENDRIIKTVECVHGGWLHEAVEYHYESGRIDVVITGGAVDFRNGQVYRYCVSERP